MFLGLRVILKLFWSSHIRKMTKNQLFISRHGIYHLKAHNLGFKILSLFLDLTVILKPFWNSYIKKEQKSTFSYHDMVYISGKLKTCALRFCHCILGLKLILKVIYIYIFHKHTCYISLKAENLCFDWGHYLSTKITTKWDDWGDLGVLLKLPQNGVIWQGISLSYSLYE